MDSSSKRDLENKLAAIFVGIIFAVAGFGCLYLVSLGGNADIIAIL